MFPAPEVPEVPAAHTATAVGYGRYEDCAQDGRLLPIGVPNHTAAIWQAMASNATARTAMQAGVIPILTRMTITCNDARIRVDRPMESRSALQLAHAVDAKGAVTRVHMNLWTEVRGAPGLARSPAPDGERIPAGRVFAEHTFTRLFAPPDQRKVLALPGESAPPPTRYTAAPFPSVTGDETWRDEAAVESTRIVFTLDQTDANQHVNSLVYIRVFLDAVQRRLAPAERVMASRAVDIVYRKPSFAGDEVAVTARLFTRGPLVGAAGSIAGTDGKPRALVRALLSR